MGLPGSVRLLGTNLGVEGELALGAQWMVWVGDEADVTRLDPVATEGVRVLPLAAGAVVHAGWLFAEARVEEGQVHAGGLEAAAARLGMDLELGEVRLGAWGGRGDLPWSADRDHEVEALLFQDRPLLSKAQLPQHATGVGGEVGWDERVAVQGGASWAAATADAPYTWARASVGPLGLPTAPEGALVPGPRPVAGVGWARLRSPTLDPLDAWTADLSLRWGRLDLSGGWMRLEGATRREEWLGQLGVGVPLRGHGGLALTEVGAALRYELVTGLLPDEERRDVYTARLGGTLRAFHPYVEARVSRERAALAEDVVVLGDTDRADDMVAVGLLLRLPEP